MGVSIAELKEYVRYVDSSAVFDCPKYPVTKESQLNLLKPGSREVVTRPFHIHEHLPPMHPHLEGQYLIIISLIINSYIYYTYILLLFFYNYCYSLSKTHCYADLLIIFTLFVSIN